MTEVTSTPNTGYTPPAAAPNRPPVKGAAAKQGFSWKSAAIGAVVLLVGIIGLVIWLAEPDPVPVPVRTQEENNNATFKIYIYEDVEVGQDAQGESLSIRAIHSNGSGVFIDSVNGYILTNYHVISEYYENTDSKPEIWVSSSVLDKAYKAEEVIISSPDTEHKGIDVAIVKLSSQMNQALQEKRVRPVVFANIDENQKELLKGKELYALGYPGISDSQREAALSRYRDEIKNATGSQMNAISKYQDIENELRDVKPSTTFLSGRIGKIDVYSPKNSHLFIEHQAPIAQGMSGGPTFLANEHTLIGLNQSYKVDRNANRVYKSVFLPEILQLISQDTTHEHTELRAVQPYKP
ncbi:MAG: trypsin-like peptidase domain-containing protein [Candidatus Kapaibacteriota bacterium]